MCYIFSIVAFIIGVMLLTGRASFFIRGWRLTQKEEKENVNIKPLCINISIMFFLFSAILAVTGYSEAFREAWFKWAIIGWYALGMADLAFINKSKRYNNKSGAEIYITRPL